MFSHLALINHRTQDRAVEQLNLRNLMRSAESIEEMKKRNARLERRDVGNQRKVLGLLHTACAEHGPAGRACRHDVAVIAKDGDRLHRDRTGSDMKGGWGKFSGDLEE